MFNGTDEFQANDLRVSTGVALLWRAPVGPISISCAIPLRKKDGDEIERLQFTFGRQFRRTAHGLSSRSRDSATKSAQ